MSMVTLSVSKVGGKGQLLVCVLLELPERELEKAKMRKDHTKSFDSITPYSRVSLSSNTKLQIKCSCRIIVLCEVVEALEQGPCYPGHRESPSSRAP